MDAGHGPIVGRVAGAEQGWGGLYTWDMDAATRVIDLGRMGYRGAYEVQCAQVEEVIAAREHGGEVGRILLVEHDPAVITVTRRPTAAANLLGSSEDLRR